MSENQSLKEKTAKGLFWGGFSNGIQQLLNLLFGIFLARLLTPADYGMVGMLAIFSLIASSIQESGFTAALVNKKEVTHNDYNAVFWFNAAISLSLYLLLFLCAPLIADFYHTPERDTLATARTFGHNCLHLLFNSFNSIAYTARKCKCFDRKNFDFFHNFAFLFDSGAKYCVFGAYRACLAAVSTI